MIRESDERSREPGPEPGWTDAWYFDWCDDDDQGGFLRLGLLPNQRVGWLWVSLVGGDGPVVVRAHDVPLPRPHSLEIRAPGLWADLICETPMTHWSLGLEAFGVRLDDPLDALGGERGHRVPLGLDLEWEAVAPPFEHPHPGGRVHAGHYQHAGRVHGQVLVGDETRDFEGFGERDRFWGVRDWWAVGWHWSAFRLGKGMTVSVARPDLPGSEHATGYVAVEGEEPHPILRADVRTESDPSGIPRQAAYGLETGLEVGLDVVSLAPVLVPDASSERVAHLVRALCHFSAPEGSGSGWAEWLRPS